MIEKDIDVFLKRDSYIKIKTPEEGKLEDYSDESYSHIYEISQDQITTKGGKLFLLYQKPKTEDYLLNNYPPLIKKYSEENHFTRFIQHETINGPASIWRNIINQFKSKFNDVVLLLLSEKYCIEDLEYKKLNAIIRKSENFENINTLIFMLDMKNQTIPEIGKVKMCSFSGVSLYSHNMDYSIYIDASNKDFSLLNLENTAKINKMSKAFLPILLGKRADQIELKNKREELEELRYLIDKLYAANNTAQKALNKAEHELNETLKILKELRKDKRGL